MPVGLAFAWCASDASPVIRVGAARYSHRCAFGQINFRCIKWASRNFGPARQGHGRPRAGRASAQARPQSTAQQDAVNELNLRGKRRSRRKLALDGL
jgi:hypothetical protein